MSFFHRYGWMAGVWVVILGTYAACSLAMKPGYSLSRAGDVLLCIVPLLANAGLLLNAGTPHWRRNAFWMLLALGCTLWLIGQFQWTYFEVYLRQNVPLIYAGDIIFFFRGIPVMAALALQPDRRRAGLKLGFGYLDFVLLLMWWAFLYAFVVMPWMYTARSEKLYNYNYSVLFHIQNFVIVGALAYLWLRASGAWRVVYAHLFGASSLYMMASLLVSVAINEGKYYTGHPLDLLLVASFLWLGTVGVLAYRYGTTLDRVDPEREEAKESALPRGESVLASRLATLAVLSLPFFTIWSLRFSEETQPVREFRVLVTVVAMVPLATLVFLRQHLADAERMRLLARSENSIENLQRLQAQLVHSEKLVSLGQLAAGAAHEINNPLTAILGFSELLAEDAALPEKTRGTAAKIREQARRTKTLVSNLLSFARQVPSERSLLDVNTVVSNAVQLRALDMHGSMRIELQLEAVLPGVRGDGNQLMQVFFNIISNAVDAMEAAGGALTIRTMRERANVVVLFTDSGPGIKDPNRVFDPFYTTKPVGKGTGLGLSICYGLIQEHGGKIICYNRPEGGAVFRIELPAVLAAFHSRDTMPAPSGAHQQKDS
jgi:signal transduction histidine kinase